MDVRAHESGSHPHRQLTATRTICGTPILLLLLSFILNWYARQMSATHDTCTPERHSTHDVHESKALAIPNPCVPSELEGATSPVRDRGRKAYARKINLLPPQRSVPVLLQSHTRVQLMWLRAPGFQEAMRAYPTPRDAGYVSLICEHRFDLLHLLFRDLAVAVSSCPSPLPSLTSSRRARGESICYFTIGSHATCCQTPMAPYRPCTRAMVLVRTCQVKSFCISTERRFAKKRERERDVQRERGREREREREGNATSHAEERVREVGARGGERA